MKLKFTKSKPKDAKIALVSFQDTKESHVRIGAKGRKEITIGIGPKGEYNRRKLILAARKIISLAKSNKVKALTIHWKDLESQAKDAKVSREDAAELITTNLEMANFSFVAFKTKPKEGWDFVRNVAIYGDISEKEKKALEKGQMIGEEVNKCRTLANTPGGDMTPRRLAEEAERAAEGTDVVVTVLDKEAIEKEKMGGILGVSRGSHEDPAVIIMEYNGRQDAKEKSIVLIGKGVTFDTGGLSLKPGEHMEEMHMDMSGGAAVIHAVVAAAKLGVKKRIIGIIPAVENMPSGASYRPGDILTSMSGKTIEVRNTDAEGRIILADALHYARIYKPEIVVDVATLTGAALVALGMRCSAIFTSDKVLMRQMETWGEASGDYVWPLPLWEEYDEEVKGTFGDVANIGKTRYGGAITAAAFLKQFVGKFPWVHIDMAPRMTSVEGEYLAKGAAGAPVRLLVKLLEEF